MAWSSLGPAITPSQTEWRFFDGVDIDGDLFRLTHSYDLGGVTGTLLIASYHPVYDSFFGIRKVFPSPQTQIIEMPVPRALAPVVRDIAIKATWRSRIYEQDNWRVSLENWIDPANPAVEFDGGEYTP